MKVKYILNKGSGIMNEDNILIKNNLFGVFDGATSLDKYRNKTGETGGHLASNITKFTFEKNDKSLKNLAIEANKKIREKMILEGIEINEKINLWSTSAAVIKINKNTFNWIQIGDSLILVVYKNGKRELITKYFDHDKNLLILWKKLADKKVKNIFEVIKKDSIKLRKTMNIKYGILNGEKKMMNFLKKGTKKLDKIKHIIIFTDGLFIPKKDPRKKENWNIFVKLFLEKGLIGIKNYIRSIEEKDKKCWEYPRYKQHDDIGAISITF